MTDQGYGQQTPLVAPADPYAQPPQPYGQPPMQPQQYGQPQPPMYQQPLPPQQVPGMQTTNTVVTNHVYQAPVEKCCCCCDLKVGQYILGVWCIWSMISVFIQTAQLNSNFNKTANTDLQCS